MKCVRLIMVIGGLLLMAGYAAHGSQHSPRPGDVWETITAGLDENAVPTGILYDRAVPLSNIGLHDGSAGSQPVSLTGFKQIYYEVTRASLKKPPWPGLRELLARSNRMAADGVIPIALANIRYNRIRPGAFADGSLRTEQGSLVVGGSPPIIEGHLFTASAMQDFTHRGSAVTFSLERDLYATNDLEEMDGIEIDFDDGLGYRPVRFGQRHRVEYRRTGTAVIRLKAYSADGSALYGSFYFHVEHLQTPNPHDTLHIVAAIPYRGEQGSGEAYVYLSDVHASITNPVVIVEGFDIDNSMNWDELYQHLNQEGLVESLRTDGFDMVVLNFAEGTDYIQRNAFAIVELLQQVAASTCPPADCVVVGASMGGLASRYALAYMETHGLDHWVRNFISFDAPNRGANIPLGIQYWMDFFSEQSADAAYMLERLDTPAARQMLVYHHTDPPGSTGESDVLRSELMADFDSVGNYPRKLRTVAIANGSGHRVEQGFAPGEQIIRYEYSSFLVDIVGNVWAVPDGAYSIIFDGLIDMIWPFPDDEMVVHVSGTRPYDSAPGGTRASMAQMDTTVVEYGDIVALYERHCFIPTVSALDLNTDDLLYDIAGEPDILSMTPFDAVYYPAENQEHASIKQENASWFMAEVRWGVTPVEDDHVAFPGLPVLFQNYPNPFNPLTTVRFMLPAKSNVSLAVYAADGRLLRTLLNGSVAGGLHECSWDGRDRKGMQATSGVYFCRLRVGSWAETRKMTLLR